MNNEFETMGAVPELTLEPFKEKPQPPLEAEKKAETLDDSILSEEEKRTVEAFAEKIDITDSTAILQYGAGTQKKMADFSESALDNVKTKDLGEVGELLSGVVKELKSFDEKKKRVFGIFKKGSNKIQSMKAKYEAETNVNRFVRYWNLIRYSF